MSNSAPFTVDRLIFICWDGTRYSELERLLANGSLPTLSSIISAGSISTLYITDHLTWTDPGHSQMFGGYSIQMDGTGDGAFASKGEGLGIFKHFKSHGISTVVINSRESERTRIDGVIYKYIGHGFFKWNFKNEMKHIDYYWGAQEYGLENKVFFIDNMNDFLILPGQLTAEVTNNKAKEWIQNNKERRFFMFMHFGDPDSRGHGYTGGSIEYSNAIIECDRITGDLVNFLSTNNIYDSKTLLVITTDHGFNINNKDHSNPPYPKGPENTYKTFFAANRSIVSSPVIGDQADTAPTLLELMGIDSTKIVPRYDISKPLWFRNANPPSDA